MEITLPMLKAVAPKTSSTWLTEFLEPLNRLCPIFQINTEKRIEHFLSQCAHESLDFTRLEENLNYTTPQRLMQVWPKRFPNVALAEQYVRNPQKLANYVYGDRFGNRAGTDDGWDFRGSGIIMLTFRGNIEPMGLKLGLSPEDAARMLRTPKGAVFGACWYWGKVGCNEYADRDDLDGVSDAINIGRQTEREGDAIGYQDRAQHLAAVRDAVPPEDSQFAPETA